MKNLLRADFYKLYRQKTFKVCLIILAVATLLTVVTMKIPVGEDSDGGKVFLGDSFGISTAKDVALSVDLTIYLAIWVALMFASEFQNGALRNAVSSGASRTQLYLSKSIVISAALFGTILLMIVFKLLLGLICFGTYGGSDAVEIWYFLRAWLMNGLLTTALAQCYMFVATFIRGTGGTLIFCLVVVDLVVSGLGSLLSLGSLKESTEWLSKISPYLLTAAQSTVAAGIGPSAKEWWLYLLTGVFCVGLFADLGIFMINKKDLK